MRVRVALVLSESEAGRRQAALRTYYLALAEIELFRQLVDRSVSSNVGHLRERRATGASGQETKARDLGGPMYDEATARKKLEEAGFDPDDLNKRAEQSEWNGILPMPTFCFKGDLYMCRYLLSKGVSTTKSCGVKDIYYPMMLAAMGGKLHVCKWLYDHGAHTDIGGVARTRMGNMLSPLFYACRSFGEHHMNVGKWLIFKGGTSIC